jgi:hypothetical protein
MEIDHLAGLFDTASVYHDDNSAVTVERVFSFDVHLLCQNKAFC